jgi:hypothetical protein
VNQEAHHENAQEKISAKPEKINVGKLEAQAKVGEIAEGVKAAVDIANSVESAENEGEGFSEGKGNKKDDSASSQNQSTQTQQNLKTHIHTQITKTKMQKEVTAAIRKEIRKKEKKVLLAYVGVKKYSPHKLAEMIAQVRSLKDLLSSIVDATKEILTGLYMKWVRLEGGK